jgi:hypothetical protein
MEVVAGRALNPGATITALTANTGSSFTVRDFPETSKATLQGLWAQSATAGIVRVHSPRLHDDIQGMRYRVPAALVRDLLCDEAEQVLYPNDNLRFEQSGGGAETDSASMLIYYDDLPGIAARLAMWEEVKPRIVNLLTVEVPVAGPVVAGDWSNGTVITALADLLKADTEYAILGYQTDTNCNSVGWSSSDTGNLKVGGPGPTETVETRDWFVSLSRRSGKPCIPMFNSNNRGSSLAFVALNTAAGTVNVSFSLAQLSR